MIQVFDGDGTKHGVMRSKAMRYVVSFYNDVTEHLSQDNLRGRLVSCFLSLGLSDQKALAESARMVTEARIAGQKMVRDSVEYGDYVGYTVDGKQILTVVVSTIDGDA